MTALKTDREARKIRDRCQKGMGEAEMSEQLTRERWMKRGGVDEERQDDPISQRKCCITAEAT